jgi:hypothetical protein
MKTFWEIIRECLGKNEITWLHVSLEENFKIGI